MGASAADREESIVQLICSANLRDGVNRNAQSPARILCFFKIGYDGWITRIPEYGYARQLWDCLLENFQPFSF